MNYLWVALGSAIGGVLRYWISVVIYSLPAHLFPWPTFAVNVVGSGLIGALAGLASNAGRFNPSGDMYLFLAVGVLGGFTTFSTFSLQVVHLTQTGRLQLALIYVLTTVLLCVVFAALGYGLAKAAG